MERVNKARIVLEWDERGKKWDLLAFAQSGCVLAKTTARSTVSWDRDSATCALAALRVELESLLW